MGSAEIDEDIAEETRKLAEKQALFQRMQGLSTEQLASVYRDLRTKKETLDKAHKKVMAGYREDLDNLENILLEKLNQQGATSIATPAGTVYKSTTTRTSVQDFNEMLDFIKEHDMWHALERRVSSKAVADYIEDTGKSFPGVATTRIVKVNIRAK